MPFRVLKYCCWIWDLSFKLYPKQEHLPVVLPIVFYQGKESWEFSTQFLDLFENAENYREFLPWFAVNLIDQAQCKEEDFKGTPMAQIGQLLLWSAFHGEAREWLRALRTLLDQMDDPGGGTDYYLLFMRYIADTQNLTADEIKEGLKAPSNPKLGEKIMTLAEQLRDEGRAEGRDEAVAAVMTLAYQLRTEGSKKAEAAVMTLADRLRAEGRKEAEEAVLTLTDQLKDEGKLETAKNLPQNGVSLEVVLKSTGLSPEKLKDASILT